MIKRPSTNFLSNWPNWTYLFICLPTGVHIMEPSRLAPIFESCWDYFFTSPHSSYLWLPKISLNSKDSPTWHDGMPFVPVRSSEGQGHIWCNIRVSGPVKKGTGECTRFGRYRRLLNDAFCKPSTGLRLLRVLPSDNSTTLSPEELMRVRRHAPGRT